MYYTESDSSYDKFLTECRIVNLTGEINENTSSAIIRELLWLDFLNSRDITLMINSGGGYIDSGLAIYDTIKTINSDVRTIVTGAAYSAAAFILIGGTKGKRLSYKHSKIMIHSPWGGATGTTVEIEVHAKEMKRDTKTLVEIMSDDTGISTKIMEKYIKTDKYITPDEAIELGLIDGLIKANKG